MIIDGRSAEASAPQDYDILIVGAGPVGITLALELSGQGLRIGLLESGDTDFDPDTQMLNDGIVTGHDAVDLAAIRLRFLGGATNHWGGRCVPMDRIDFERAPLGGLTGWPISYDEMWPYYERAHPYFQIGRPEYDPLEIGDVSRDDLMLPDAEILRTVVIRQSDMQFGPTYEQALADAEDIDLWLWTNVTGLDIDGDGQIRGVTTRTLSGVAREFRARFVVLACGAVENARQLLAYNARAATQLGNEGDLLGRGYMDHPAAGAGFLWLDDPLPPQIYWSLPPDTDGTTIRFLWSLSEDVLAREGLNNIQFYLIPFDETRDPRIREANQGWSALRGIAKWMLGDPGRNFQFSEAYCNAITNADVLAADALGMIDREGATTRLLLKYEVEQRPDRDNRVTLSDERDALGQFLANLHWSPSDADRDSIIRTTTLIGQAVGAAGLGRVELEDHFDEPYWASNTSWHQMGTTRMSAAPEDGVVDVDGRLWGSENLYLAGGSVMPTGGRANPTMTMVALSIRLADHLKQRMAA
ncbi:GMC family oxidoreductase [Gymnodinialimonas sp. 2305UL16-5]|uniref:GMC family oxidoreductase n=1 Tax=Gymnodinialimonas mytili TaxID=3126503 RepID=UPI0030A96CEC